MRKVALFVLLIALVWGGLTMLNMADRGIPVTSIIAAVPPSNVSVNPGPAAARATQYAGQSAAAATESAYLVQQQQAAQLARDAEYARQTQVVIERTAEVERLYTATAVQATLDAARAESTQVAGVTATAQYWQQAQQAQTATVDAIKVAAMAGEATKIADDQIRRNEREDLKLRTASATAWFWANWQLWLFLVFCSVLGGMGFAGFKYLAIQQSTAVGIIPMDEHGNSYSAVVGGKIHNSNLMTAPTLDPRQVTIPVTAELALEVAKLNQARNSIWGLGKNGYKRDAYQAAQMMTQTVGHELQAPADDPTDPAPWDLSDWGGKALPLGLTYGGSAIDLDPQHTPNLVVASTSDGGKTMRALRPLTAEALASGWYVITANIKGGDFAPLDHPNRTDISGQATEVADLLKSVLGEVERRNQVLKDAGISTYYRLTNAQEYIGPRIMVVIDEIVSLIYGAPDKATVTRLWKASINIASKCRAMGVMMVLAGTDISYRLGSDWLALRGNCGRMAFRMYDKRMSECLLNMNGAETLRGAQFMALLGGEPIRGVAFQPQDDDIRRFLISHPVPVLPAPAFFGAQQVPVKVDLGDVFDPATITLAEKIKDVWDAGGSKSAMARHAGFTQYGGSMAFQINAAIDYLVKKYGSTSTGSL